MLDLEAIRARYKAWSSLTYVSAIGSPLSKVIESASDVAALIAEVERLRAPPVPSAAEGAMEPWEMEKRAASLRDEAAALDLRAHKIRESWVDDPTRCPDCHGTPLLRLCDRDGMYHSDDHGNVPHFGDNYGDPCRRCSNKFHAASAPPPPREGAQREEGA